MSRRYGLTSNCPLMSTENHPNGPLTRPFEVSTDHGLGVASLEAGAFGGQELVRDETIVTFLLHAQVEPHPQPAFEGLLLAPLPAWQAPYRETLTFWHDDRVPGPMLLTAPCRRGGKASAVR